MHGADAVRALPFRKIALSAEGNRGMCCDEKGLPGHVVRQGISDF
jgi:hypothetical protein